jgi:hypothetical protein
VFGLQAETDHSMVMDGDGSLLLYYDNTIGEPNQKDGN